MVYDTFTLPIVPPFRLDLTVWALRRRETNLVDRWDGRQYLRVFVFNNTPVKVTVVSKKVMNEPQFVVTLQVKAELTDRLRKDVHLLIQKMLGPTINLQSFYTLSSKNDSLKLLVQQYRGVKPPRFPSIFEALINSIACQQVNLDLGILMINRLAENFGTGFTDGGITYRAFPRPEDLAIVSEKDLKKLGFSYQKVRAIKELSINVANDEIDLTNLEELTNEEAMRFLSSLHGIGRWSAEYVLLRGLGRVDIFPGDDVGAKNNLQRLFHMDKRPSYEDISEMTSQWHPFEGLVYFHLLLDKLHAKGIL
jgi:DNA-3-methyladenine glycosylase II